MRQVGEMNSFLDGEPIQGVYQSYSGRNWKAWEYRRLGGRGLIGEIEDPFAAVKWQQVLGGEGFLRSACPAAIRWPRRFGEPRPKP
jgi:hypothetical protein